jgi:hemoglobin
VALVNRFSDLMETLPEGSNLRRFHGRGRGIANARIEQVDFK